MALLRTNGLIVQSSQRLTMIETVTSGVGAIASSAMPCSVQLRTERAAALPTRTDPPMAASTALFSSTLQLEQSAMSNGPCTAGQAHREASMSEATAHSVHTLTLTREFASWRVPPVISIASTCRASTGSFAQHNAVFDGKDRANLQHPLPVRFNPYALSASTTLVTTVTSIAPSRARTTA